MRSRLLVVCFVVALCVVVWLGRTEVSEINKKITIEIGVSSNAFLEKNGLNPKKSIDRQAAGVNFYEKEWPNEEPGEIFVFHGRHSFYIRDVIGFSGTEDIGLPEIGIYKFSTSSLISSDELVSHEEARVKFMGLIKSLVDSGWRYYIPYWEPRLAGKESFDYARQDGSCGFSPDYVPTLDEWMALGSKCSWTLYADGVFVEVSFYRDSSKMNRAKEGAYLVSFRVHGVYEHSRLPFSRPEDRERWLELWPSKIKQYKLSRNKIESALKQKGVIIFNDYVDPIVHPADPIEIDEF